MISYTDGYCMAGCLKEGHEMPQSQVNDGMLTVVLLALLLGVLLAL